MPVFKAGEGQAPAWSELEMFEIIHLKKGQAQSFAFRGPKEKVICLEGDITLHKRGASEPLAQFAIADIPAGAEWSVSSEAGGSLMRLCGCWGDELGGSGVFPVFVSDNPKNPGDPADYPRNASFDNHYHDCDEYWIVYRGSGRAVSEGVAYDVGPGDCVATGRGHHHDFPIVHESISAVFLETTLVGQKRLGHLWAHTHGPAQPDAGRV